jgi:mRNA interferase MazF
MNKALRTIIVLPLTTSVKDWPTRVTLIAKKTSSQACIEHIRSVSKERFLQRIDSASEIEMAAVRKHLAAVFAE